MAIIATHLLFYSPEAQAVRAVFSDVLGLPHVDAGDGWLIFRGPPAELAVHPSDAGSPGSTRHEIALVCDDLEATLNELRGKPGVHFDGDPKDEGWGITIHLVLPGELRVLLYQPRHPLAIEAE